MSEKPNRRGEVAERLLSCLSARGVVCSVAGGDLHIKAPRGALSAREIAAMRDLKAELLALLAPVQAGVDDDPFPPTATHPAFPAVPRCTEGAPIERVVYALSHWAPPEGWDVHTLAF